MYCDKKNSAHYFAVFRKYEENTDDKILWPTNV